MEKTVLLLLLLLLLLKAMTKTSQLNDIAMMIYHGGCPVQKHHFFVFCYYFNENHMKDMQINKEIVLSLKPIAKNPSMLIIFTWTVNIC